MSGFLEQDYFTLFGIPRSFEVDTELLARRYRELQRELHPDRYAREGPQAQRLAVQYTARLNDAVATLRSPLKRALYLLELAGRPLSDGDRQQLPSAFLMEQMNWREALEDAANQGSPDALEVLARDVNEARRKREQEFAGLIENADASCLEQAADRVRELQFLDKLEREIAAEQERLDA